jgi:RNA polymerase sigma factor (sigma-70 family)
MSTSGESGVSAGTESVDEKNSREDPADSAFRHHYRAIYRYLRRRTESAAEAEELAAEVFADAAAALHEPRSDEPPVLAFLYVLARRRFADAARRRAASSRPVSLEDFADELAELERDEALTQALRRALGNLPPELGKVVAMKLVQGRPFAEIARELGVSEVACRKRFQRGLAALRAALSEEGVEP